MNRARWLLCLLLSCGFAVQASAQETEFEFQREFVATHPEPVEDALFASDFDVNGDGTRMVVTAGRAPGVEAEFPLLLDLFERASVDVPWGAPVARIMDIEDARGDGRWFPCIH